MRTSAFPACVIGAILAGYARAGEVFVGRVRELRELERALDAARAGSGATVLVAGEAGIGKTRLASELTARARDAGFEVLLGRSIDLVGTELPYQPFVEALRPLGELRRVDGQTAGSQLRVFEEALALLTDRAAARPVLLVLEDLHWADTSTLDLVVFLAHNLDDRRVLLLATYRADELSSSRAHAPACRRRPALGLGARARTRTARARRDGSAARGARRRPLLPPALTDAIVARSEGNPFFAEELLAAARRPARASSRAACATCCCSASPGSTDPTQSLLRLAAAAGRDVAYPLLRAAAGLPERDVRESLRQAVEHGVLVADRATGSFRFRHALLAEAIYATILPGEREELHARLAEELARTAAAAPAELAPHWAAAGRSAEALAASVEAAREAEAVFGLAEALAHLERALALVGLPCRTRAELMQLDLGELCTWAAELASQTGAAPRAVELARRAIELVGANDPPRAALLHESLARYLHESGRADAALAAARRAVELVPAQPPSPERAQALAALGHGLMLAWRHEESCRICLQALALARAVGARAAELRALTVLGVDLAYLGRGDQGLAQLWLALQLAEESADPIALERAYVSLTDVLMMLGRPRESARLAETALEALHRYGIDHTTLVANQIEALLAIGEWDQADAPQRRRTPRHHRQLPPHAPHHPRRVEVGRGDFDARAGAPRGRTRHPARLDRDVATYDAHVAELALWERRWTDADEAVHDGLAARALPRDRPDPRLALRRGTARAGRAGGARPRPPGRRRPPRPARPRVQAARHRSPRRRGGLSDHPQRRRLARPGRGRVRARPRPGRAPETWSEAQRTWERLERPPLAAYCRWRQAEALVAAGAPRAEATVPLREAHAVAARTRAKPLLRELELLAERARLDLAPPEAEPSDRKQGLEEILGLTPREAEVLTLVARGYTDREIAATLVISVKTASVHVSHILRKLGAPNRLEAAAIMHRLSPPQARQPESGA